MKIKPKEVLINVPVVLMFDTTDEIAQFAANINTVLHGKQRFKYEELGILGKQYVGIFYLYRNDEFSELREQFTSMIDAEEIAAHKELPLKKERKPCPEPSGYSGWCNVCHTKHNEG